MKTKRTIARVVAAIGGVLAVGALSAVGCANGLIADDGPDASTPTGDAALVCDACGDGQVCNSGACSSACSNGETACSGTCVDLKTDSKHCGTCAKACATGYDCVNSVCTCAPPTLGCGADSGTDAALVCIDPQTDTNNCGSCNNICDDGGSNATPGCIDGGCGIGSCVGSYADCDKTATDGCESDLTSDKNNCGSCGYVCDAGSPACNDGGCIADLCGNGVIDTGERCDGNVDVPSGGQITCRGTGTKNECKFDFSKVPQLYCNGSCSWAGGSGCDSADADIYCKLITGSSTSTSTAFTTATAEAVGGFPCWGGGYGTNLGPMPEYGVSIDVYYQGTSILANHGAGTVISGATCTP